MSETEISIIKEVCPDCRGRRAHIKSLYDDTYYGRSWWAKCQSCAAHGEIVRVVRRVNARAA